MTTELYEEAILATRQVLSGVTKQQLAHPTPCARWTVGDLINHIVGAQYFFAASLNGEPPGGEDTDFAGIDFVSAFDEAAERSLTRFRMDGMLEKTLSLPFGEMTGEAFSGLAATDTFTHGWDLAKATGQGTDLNPRLAQTLLTAARQNIPPSFRSDEGTVFGPEQVAPAGASEADQLAAFLGRKV